MKVMSMNATTTPPPSTKPAPSYETLPPPRFAAEAIGREAAKRALRAYGMASADLRPLPDFLLVGAKRGGTTSMWRYLAEHDGMLTLFPRPENIKGTYYFDENFARGDRWYRSHFPTVGKRHLAQRRVGHSVVTGESTPYYLYHPLAPDRAHALVPDAVIVVVLRDPVERAFSHYKERRSNGSENLSFAEAIDLEPARLAGEEERILADDGYVSFSHRHASYLDQGRYAPMLERWFNAYGRDRVIVEISEEMYADPQSSVDRVTDRLGLPRRALRHPEQYNAEPDTSFDPEIRARLQVQLAPDIAAAEDVLGRKLPWGI
jgi:hypothetical protein